MMQFHVTILIIYTMIYRFPLDFEIQLLFTRAFEFDSNQLSLEVLWLHFDTAWIYLKIVCIQ